MEAKRLKIPVLLNHNELYDIANNIENDLKIYKESRILLFHKSELLENDKTPIKNISNGNFIKIKELLELDDSYYE